MTAAPFDGSQPGPPFGHFTYLVKSDRWHWSEGMYALHGFEPGEVPATTQVLLSHKHPDDRSRTYEVLERAIRDGQPFSCYHRIIDSRQRVRSVVSIGNPVTGSDGTVESITGCFVDLTEVQRSETNAEVQKALAVIAETRGLIEQAKGIVMLATGCTHEAAFEVLRRSSQHANIKLQQVARELVASVGDNLCASADTELSVLTYLESLTLRQATTIADPGTAEPVG